MEVISIVILIAIVIFLKEDETAMDEEQIKQCKKIKGETQLEKSKAKKSIFTSISNFCNIIKF